MNPFTIGAKQSTVPVVLSAIDPAATSSDADWGPVTFKVTSRMEQPLHRPNCNLLAASEEERQRTFPQRAVLRKRSVCGGAPAAQFSLTVISRV